MPLIFLWFYQLMTLEVSSLVLISITVITNSNAVVYLNEVEAVSIVIAAGFFFNDVA